MVLQLLILAFLLFVIPYIAGGIFKYADNIGDNLLFRWVSGQILLWAGFQLICVPLVLKEKDFNYVVVFFSGYTAALVLLTAASKMRHWKKKKVSLGFISFFHKKRLQSVILWVVFWGLLLFQLVQAVRLAYADGDDAYYVAISALTEESDTMYSKIPYTGETTGLDARHGLAPFPVWISFLARVSGMQAVTVAQVVLPVVLISMTYAVFYLLGCRIFRENRKLLPLFMIFTELGVLFGDYSFYTMENFLIARSRQGKAALGSIVIPFILLLFLVICQRLEQKQQVTLRAYLLLGAAGITGCLCSTLGALLVCVAVGIMGLLAAICYKKPGILAALGACCIPCICFVLIYFLLD